MKRFKRLCAAFLLAAPTAMAQQGLRFQTAPDAPLDVTAVKMQWQQNNNLADLTGMVVVVQGPMRLEAEQMRIVFENGAARHLRARNNVHLRDEDGQTAQAANADFDLQNDQLVLRGEVVLERQEATGERQKLIGDTLKVDMVSGKANLKGGKSRARIELQSD